MWYCHKDIGKYINYCIQTSKKTRSVADQGVVSYPPLLQAMPTLLNDALTFSLSSDIEHPVLCDCTGNYICVLKLNLQHGMLNAPGIKADTN